MTQSQYYFGWQIDMKNVNNSVRDALDRYYKKFGLPPQLVLVSDRLTEKLDLNLVVQVQHVPANILYIGRHDETSSNAQKMQNNSQDEIQN
jgi:hypothetical protein